MSSLPDRNSADNLPFYLGQKKRRRHPVCGWLNAKSLILQPPKVVPPYRPLLQTEQELETILRKLPMCLPGRLLVLDNPRAQQYRRWPLVSSSTYAFFPVAAT